MVALPSPVVYWRVKPEVSDNPYVATDWNLSVNGTFIPQAGARVQVLSVGPSAIAEAVAQNPLVVLEVSDDDSAIVVTGLNEEATHYELVIEPPSAYAGTYSASVADLAAGLPVKLRDPVLTANGRQLTATPALWVYDPAVYEASNEVFTRSSAWKTDTGALLDGQTLIWQRNTYRAVEFYEEVYAADGVTLRSATSNLIPAIPIPVTNVFPAAARPVNIGTLMEGKRAFSMATAMTMQEVVQNMRIASRDSTPTVGSHTSGTAAFQTGTGASTGGNVSLGSVGNAYTANSPVCFASSGDLNRFGSNIRAQMWVGSNLVNDLRTITSDVIVDPTLFLTPITGLFARLNNADPLRASIRGWFWLDDRPIPANKLRDALFEPVPVGVSAAGFLPRLLPDDGTVIIDGASITPLVFIRDQFFGQFQQPPGTGPWVVPNRGRAGGTLALPNGAFV